MEDRTKTAPAAQEQEELVSLEEAADLLCVSKSTLYRMLERGEVKGRKVGRQWRFRKADIAAYLDRGPHAVVLSSVRDDEIDQLLSQLAEAQQEHGLPVLPVPSGIAADEKIGAVVQALWYLAIKLGASDLHVVPVRNGAVIRPRIDGVMHDLITIPGSVYPALVTQFKVCAGMNIEERRLPQDGRIHMKIEAQDYDLRINVLPTIFGESVVMRILSQSAVLLGLDRLYFAEDDLARLRRWIASPNGQIVFTGPTGSGKTTTMYSCLHEIAGPEKNTMTVEDPVEYLLPHTRQVAVNRHVGLTFASALRAFLRHDPDIIMIGEIRDLETAEIAVQAALTGHLVLTSLHTNDAPAVTVRLADMGVEPFLIGGCLLGAVGQRLVRRLCPACKEPVELPAEILAHIRELAAHGGYTVPENAQFYRAVGCAQCSQRGYRGRIGLYELFEMTHAAREAVLRRAPLADLRRIAVTDGMHTLAADGIRKAVEGITTVDEVLRVTMM